MITLWIIITNNDKKVRLRCSRNQKWNSGCSYLLNIQSMIHGENWAVGQCLCLWIIQHFRWKPNKPTQLCYVYKSHTNNLPQRQIKFPFITLLLPVTTCYSIKTGNKREWLVQIDPEATKSTSHLLYRLYISMSGLSAPALALYAFCWANWLLAAAPHLPERDENLLRWSQVKEQINGFCRTQTVVLIWR